MMRSIRRFLVLMLIAVIILVVFLSILRGYARGLQKIELQLDKQLQQKIDIFQAVLSHGGTRDWTGQMSLLEKFHHSNDAMFQLWQADGASILRSGNSPAKPMTDLTEGLANINYGGYRWRVMVAKHPDNNWIIVADRDDARFRIADNIIIETLGPIVVGLFIVALLIWLIVGYGMRPISDLALKLRHKHVTDLSPLRLDEVPEELQELGQSINALLTRLEASFEREKRFSADAAHELRNPITALFLQAQNLLEESPEPDPSVRKLVHGVSRVGALVEQILLLNRMAPDHYNSNFTSVELFSLSQAVISELYADAVTKSLTVELEGDPCIVTGDEFGLATLIKNLVSNAIKYTPPGGRLLVKTGLEKRQPYLLVMDSGPGIPPAEYQRVFDRFYRLGGDRHQSKTAGSGLGLSIVQNIVALHQASITLAPSAFESGMAVKVRFPGAAAEIEMYERNNA